MLKFALLKLNEGSVLLESLFTSPKADLHKCCKKPAYISLDYYHFTSQAMPIMILINFPPVWKLVHKLSTRIILQNEMFVNSLVIHDCWNHLCTWCTLQSERDPLLKTARKSVSTRKLVPESCILEVSLKPSGYQAVLMSWAFLNQGYL